MKRTLNFTMTVEVDGKTGDRWVPYIEYQIKQAFRAVIERSGHVNLRSILYIPMLPDEVLDNMHYQDWKNGRAEI